MRPFLDCCKLIKRTCGCIPNAMNHFNTTFSSFQSNTNAKIKLMKINYPYTENFFLDFLHSIIFKKSSTYQEIYKSAKFIYYV